MNRRRALPEILSWSGCIVILAGLVLGLDSYKRLPMEYGYGPHRRQYLLSTQEKARELQERGSIQLVPGDRWHLLSGWQDELTLTKPPRALAVHRRARFVLPVLEPEDFQVRVHVKPVPPPGHESRALELELGVSGAAGVRRTVPPDGKLLTLRTDRSSLHRGDNALFLYRISPRSDPGPWVSVGRIEVERALQSVP